MAVHVGVVVTVNAHKYWRVTYALESWLLNSFYIFLE
jgi:uncharacterized membrane protein